MTTALSRVVALSSGRVKAYTRLVNNKPSYVKEHASGRLAMAAFDATVKAMTSGKPADHSAAAHAHKLVFRGLPSGALRNAHVNAYLDHRVDAGEMKAPPDRPLTSAEKAMERDISAPGEEFVKAEAYKVAAAKANKASREADAATEDIPAQHARASDLHKAAAISARAAGNEKKALVHDGKVQYHNEKSPGVVHTVAPVRKPLDKRDGRPAGFDAELWADMSPDQRATYADTSQAIKEYFDADKAAQDAGDYHEPVTQNNLADLAEEAAKAHRRHDDTKALAGTYDKFAANHRAIADKTTDYRANPPANPYLNKGTVGRLRGSSKPTDVERVHALINKAPPTSSVTVYPNNSPNAAALLDNAAVMYGKGTPKYDAAVKKLAPKGVKALAPSNAIHGSVSVSSVATKKDSAEEKIAPGKYHVKGNRSTGKAYMKVKANGSGTYVNSRGESSPLTPKQVLARHTAGMNHDPDA